MRDLLVRFVATFGGVGYLPLAPGSWATAAGAVLAYFVADNLAVYTILTLVLFGLGVVATGLLERQLGRKDPGIAVIDEVVGILVALWGLPLIWPVVLTGYFLFRAFDMFKIYPINKLEALQGGWGIMLDDFFAGVYTNLVLRIALRCAGLF